MLKIITDEITGTSVTLRVYAPVSLTAGEPWQISYRMKLGSDTSSTCIVLLNSSVYSGTGGPPSWGSAWICGFGKWSSTTAGASDMPYLTSASSGGWYANPTSGEYHKIDMKYYPGKGVRYFLDNTLIGTYNITIGTRIGYITAYIHTGNSIKDLVFLDKTDLLIDDYTRVVIFGSDYSVISYDETGNDYTVTGTLTTTTSNTPYGTTAISCVQGSYMIGAANAITLGGQDWTIDWWMYMSSSTSQGGYIFRCLNSSGASDMYAHRTGDNTGRVTCGFNNNGAGVIYERTGVSVLNQKVHIALVYEHNKSAFSIFLNGVKKVTITGTSLRGTRTLEFLRGDSGYNMVGTISQFRISDGIARWTTNFANRLLPISNGPTLQDTLCLPMNGQDECGNPMYWDGSTPAITDDSNSYPSIHSPKYNFANNRRFWFDNVGLGGADFTIEGWAYVSTSTESYGRVFEWVNTGSTGTRLEFGKLSTNNYLYFYYSGTHIVNNLYYMNQNFHFALVYEHGAQKFSVYINGVLKGTYTVNIPFQYRRLWISGSSTNSASRLCGNISEFRVSHDIARWTESFPMYNQTFTKDTYTVALCHFTSSPTADDCGHTWSVVGTPDIINGELSLDGSSYLQLDGGIDIGGQDFTVEAWVCQKQYSGYRRIWHIGNTLNKNDITLCNNSTTGAFWWSTNGTNIITGTNYWNQRVHVAQVYKHSEGKSYYYVNGILVGTTTNTIARYHAQYVWLGRGAYTDAYMVGQIKEFRISDGIARYNHAFPLPAQDFPDGTPGTRYIKDPNTKILLHGDNPYFFSNTPATDWCGNVFKYCQDLSVTTDYAKFTNALLITPHESWLKSTTPFNFTGQDFCIDFWAYTTTPAAYSSNVPAFFSLNKDIHETPYPRLILYLSAATTLRVETNNLVGAVVGAQATVTMLNTLNHYAVTYSAGVVKVYVNGVLKITLTANLETARYYVCIGGNPSANTVNMFNSQYGGYISEFRISNNTTRWTADFTPATAAYGTDTNTWALLHFSSVTADACSNTTWEQYCTKPVFSTTVVPFPNTSSVYFANGAKLHCDSFKLGGADFTIEGWFYLSSTQGAYARIFEYLPSPSVISHGMLLYRSNTSAALVLQIADSANSSASITVNVSDNAWHHWAVVQEYAAGTNKLYIDGIYKGVVAKVIDRISRPFIIGRSTWLANGPTVGYMADFHITDGIAKYKKSFQPPLELHYSRGKFKDTTTYGTSAGSVSSYSHAGVKDSYGSTTDSSVQDFGNTYVRKSFATQGSTGVLERNALSVTKQKTGGLVTQSKGAKNYVSDKTGVRAQVPEILNTTFDYNGAAQFPVLRNIDYDKVSVTNFVATAAGTYDLTLTLKNLGYLWTMGHKDPIIKQWTINSILALDSSAPSSITLNPSINRATFLVNDSGSTVTVKTSNAAVATAEVSGRTITVWRKGTGSATITVTTTSDNKSVTMPVTVSAIDDATVSYMKFDNAASPITDLVSANTWVPYGFQAVYYGQTLANKNQNFDLSKDWSVSFDYTYVSGRASDWNCVFSFGHTINIHGNDSHIQIFGGNSTGTYSATYNATAHTLTTVINGTTTVTENYTRTETSYNGFYVGAGGCWCNHTFYCKSFTISAYLAGATIQSTGTYNFAGGTLTGTGDIKIDVFRSGGIRAIDNVKYVGTTNARSGYSLAFEGSQYLQKTGGFTVGGQDFTIEYWTYASTSVTRSTPFIFKVNQADSGYWRIYCYIHHSIGPFMPGVGLSSNTYATGSGDQRGQFIHIAHVYNHTAKTYKTYINGVLKTTQNITIDSREWPYCYIGYQCNSGEPKYSGTMDEFRYSNIARYSGDFTPLTTAYDLVGPSTVVTVPSGNVGYTGSLVQPAYDTDTIVVDPHNNIEVTGGNKTAVYKLKDTINMCWPDGTIAPKTVTYAITKTTAYYDQRCVTDLGNISANTIVDLSTLSTAGQNEFEYVDNTFRSGSSSYCVNSGQSHYWIKVTPTVDMTVNVTAQVGSENNYDFGLISVATSRSIPGKGATSITNGSIIMRGCNVVAKNTWSYNMTASTTYWVGFHYAKDGSVNSNGDRLWIHGINFTVTGSAISDATGNVWNFSGTPTIQSSVAKFGNALSLNGNSYLIIPNNAPNPFADTTMDFTVDWWEYRTRNSGYGDPVFSFSYNLDGAGESIGCGWIERDDTSKIKLIVNDDRVFVWMGDVILNQWVHRAFVKKDNHYYGFQNGVLYVNQESTVLPNAYSTSYPMIIGKAYSGGTMFQGYIDEFRISNVARWTTDFTPPTAQYGYDANTVVLLHF